MTTICLIEVCAGNEPTASVLPAKFRASVGRPRFIGRAGVNSLRAACFHLLWGMMVYSMAMPAQIAAAAHTRVQVDSPNQRNSISLSVQDRGVFYQVHRDDRAVINPSKIEPKLAHHQLIDESMKIVDVKRGEVEEDFRLPWGKTKKVDHHCSTARVTLSNSSGSRWQLDLRAYDDGVAFRYRIMNLPGLKQFTLREEATQFDVAGEPIVLFNTLDSFTSSHESLYERKPLPSVPSGTLMDCPVLLVWPNAMAAAITEARVMNFAGLYLRRNSADDTAFTCTLSPLPKRPNARVVAQTPRESPWRVILLADQAGKLIESNLLLCLNDPPVADHSWARPGKSTFHWWYGEFEDDHKLPNGREVFVARHREYIDFCAENNIAYHAVSGDGLAWYTQSSTDYTVASEDADVRQPRPEIGLPEILAYAHQRGVGIRLWVHWQALNKHLEEAMAVYQSWGVKGLMVDFLDRDDQEMISFSQRMLESAARHKIHIQIHGSSKFSGEQRTYPHLFNREGVLNLEYVKWSDSCTPAHSVNVAYTRALAGPVDFHLGGFRSVPRAEFEPRDRAPFVMGTRCHNLALYVVYINPMPMVADAPSSYVDQTGFEFIKTVPTTWDETRFVMGEAGEYIVIARRHGRDWYLSGITNWTPRKIQIPLDFLGAGNFEAISWVDGSQESSHPNEIRLEKSQVSSPSKLNIQMASGGGFVSIFRPQ